MVSGSTEMSMPLKEDFDISHFPREGGMPHHFPREGDTGEAPGLVRRQKQEQGERPGRGSSLGSGVIPVGSGPSGLSLVVCYPALA